MENFVCYTFVVATASAFILTLLFKWGAIEYMQVRGCKIISKMAQCNFCLSWWSCLTLAMLIALSSGRLDFIDGVVCAFCATPITRILL